MKYTLDNLPKADVNLDMPHPSGSTIHCANVADAIVSVLSGGKLVVDAYTVGIAGRGTLNMPADEFKQLLGSMAALYIATGGEGIALTDVSAAE